MAVSHFELGNPLVIVISALDSYRSYFDYIWEGHLNPLLCIVCFGRPGASSTSTAGFVESGVGSSVAASPLTIK